MNRKLIIQSTLLVGCIFVGSLFSSEDVNEMAHHDFISEDSLAEDFGFDDDFELGDEFEEEDGEEPEYLQADEDEINDENEDDYEDEEE